jgi:uncharacterized pyridoxamine 5'-phosphate oxidase family protein
MARQIPAPIDPTQLVSLAQVVMRADPFPDLATLDGDQPRVRPITPVLTDGFVVYFGNLRGYNKTVEIAANPKVELCYLDDYHDHVRITGIAEVVVDPELLSRIWEVNPAPLRPYLGRLDNPELVVYRVLPQRVRFIREWALEYQEVPLEEQAT